MSLKETMQCGNLFCKASLCRQRYWKIDVAIAAIGCTSLALMFVNIVIARNEVTRQSVL